MIMGEKGIAIPMTDILASARVEKMEKPPASGGTQALLRLMSWLSPAFPIGAFSYSSGLEQAVADGGVADAASLQDWLSGALAQGAGWNDAVLLAESYRAAGEVERLHAVAALAEAMAGSQERQMETMLQGEAFLAAASAWPTGNEDRLPERVAYPVAVGTVAGLHGAGLEPAIAAYLHASASNQISVAIRCGVLGQRAGVAVLAALETEIAVTAARAAASSLDDLGSAGILADIAGVRHETLASRLFRS
ncbi:urease accessory protein [Rhizobium sp. PP-F2F-G48]|nr:urease accessory protein [Rhizobium sp. PP-F2F-G48]